MMLPAVRELIIASLVSCAAFSLKSFDMSPKVTVPNKVLAVAPMLCRYAMVVAKPLAMVPAVILKVRAMPSPRLAVTAVTSMKSAANSPTTSRSPPASLEVSARSLASCARTGMNSAASAVLAELAYCPSTVSSVLNCLAAPIVSSSMIMPAAWAASPSSLKPLPPSESRGTRAVASSAIASMKKVICAWLTLAFFRLVTYSCSASALFRLRNCSAVTPTCGATVSKKFLSSPPPVARKSPILSLVSLKMSESLSCSTPTEAAPAA
ncbi:hypothetical protein D3C77_359880 [compost metagenome]